VGSPPHTHTEAFREIRKLLIKAYHPVFFPASTTISLSLSLRANSVLSIKEEMMTGS
jgi:hypothetical protein